MQSVRITLFNYMLGERLNELQQKPEPPYLYGKASYWSLISQTGCIFINSNRQTRRPGKRSKDNG
jgi:hypothetical protein